MKKLFLIRHAKSDWPDNTTDFDRPLAESGTKDAQNMAAFISLHHDAPDLLLVSAARRTQETAAFFLQKFPHAKFQTEMKLYNAAPNDFIEVLEALPDTIESLAVFSHNNGISYFANSLSEENIRQLPTCAVAIFEINSNSWKDFGRAQKTFKALHTPKDIE